MKLTKNEQEGLLSMFDVPNYLGDRGPFFSREQVRERIQKWFRTLD